MERFKRQKPRPKAPVRVYTRQEVEAFFAEKEVAPKVVGTALLEKWMMEEVAR